MWIVGNAVIDGISSVLDAIISEVGFPIYKRKYDTMEIEVNRPMFRRMHSLSSRYKGNDYYELEHYINDALGSYLTIDRYQIPADNYIVFDVYLRSSYYTDADLLNDKPIWLVVDEFRCLCN